MHPVKPAEKRGSARSRHYRSAKIRLGAGALPRDCLIIDISDSGLRLNVEGLDVPDEFVLLSGAQESTYKVAWRFGYDLGAKFVSVVRRPGSFHGVGRRAPVDRRQNFLRPHQR
jgi:hypothetical protein